MNGTQRTDVERAATLTILQADLAIRLRNLDQPGEPWTASTSDAHKACEQALRDVKAALAAIPSSEDAATRPNHCHCGQPLLFGGNYCLVGHPQ